jgi:hypothetical protein
MPKVTNCHNTPSTSACAAAGKSGPEARGGPPKKTLNNLQYGHKLNWPAGQPGWCIPKPLPGNGSPFACHGKRSAPSCGFTIVHSTVQEAGMSNKVVQAISFACGIALAPALVCAQDSTTTIKRDSEAAKAMQEPSFQTREERLRSKPLDWNTTIGKPKRKPMTAAEKRALARAKPETAEGGKPDPRADEEARKMHPEEWKKMEEK